VESQDKVIQAEIIINPPHMELGVAAVLVLAVVQEVLVVQEVAAQAIIGHTLM
jgi:hypothetical protein